MAWEIIKRQRGVRRSAHVPGVSMSWRFPGKAAAAVAYFTVNAHLVRELGWSKPLKVVGERDRVNGLLRLRPLVHEDAYAGAYKDACVSIGMPLDGVQSERRPARAIAFQVEGDALILTLPDWAAPERRGLAGAEKARQEAIARATAPAAAPARQPFTSVTARVPDPAAGRRVG